MNQLVYLVLIFIITFILSYFYFFCIKYNRLFKLLMIILFSLLFTLCCYKFNYFIFNEYVVLDILYAIYISYAVKINVKKKNKM